MDNQEALKLAEMGILHSRTKHIDVKFMHCHDKQVKGTLRFIYVPTKDNVADLMTKPLPTERHIRLMELLGLWNAGHWTVMKACALVGTGHVRLLRQVKRTRKLGKQKAIGQATAE
jgi:hypothetical protein